MTAHDAKNIMLMNVYNGIIQIASIGENKYIYKGKLSSDVIQKLHDDGFKMREQIVPSGGFKTIIEW